MINLYLAVTPALPDKSELPEKKEDIIWYWTIYDTTFYRSV